MNHLVDESSPYLQQHAQQPVDWYPYSSEILRQAIVENKLLFISIGYSACHWCHVMAHESFDNPTVASYLNEHFISIKIDREERPDLDQIYQTLAQIMGKNGGWPLSIFLTPSGKPLYAGTYFPPTARFGLPSFIDLLKQIMSLYSTHQVELDKAGEEIFQFLQQIQETKTISSGSSITAAQSLSQKLMDSFVADLLDSIDQQHGGFGTAPKFPNFPALVFLMRALVEPFPQKSPYDATLRKGILLTLDQMAARGLYDHVGGGFHRYSVDDAWQVPHFEKMLYDNAMALVTYAEAYQLFGLERYKDIVRGIIEWLVREMYDAKSGFYSSMDADSDGKEGIYYTWKYDELKSILTSEEFTQLSQKFDISPQGNFEHRIIFHQTKEDLSNKMQPILIKLRTIREKRNPPGTDRKIITSWNALLLHGLYAALPLFEFAPLGDQIRKITESLAEYLRTMIDSTSGQVFRVHMNGSRKILGMLDDYAYLIQAYLDEYSLTRNTTLLKTIEKLFVIVNDHFWDPITATYFYNAKTVQDLLIRPTVYYDMPIPSPVAIMEENLIRYTALAPSTPNFSWFSPHDRTDQQLLELTIKNSAAMASYLLILQWKLFGPIELTLEGSQSQIADLVPSLHLMLGKYYLPRFLMHISPQKKEEESKTVSIRLILCRHHTCMAPVDNLQSFEEILQKSFLHSTYASPF